MEAAPEGGAWGVPLALGRQGEPTSDWGKGCIPAPSAASTTPASAAAPVSSTGVVLDGVTATLLAGVVLIDTLNMDPAAKKGTPRDAAVLDHLMPLVASTAWGRRMTNSFAAASCSSSSPSMASAASVGSVEEPGRPCGGDEP